MNLVYNTYLNNTWINYIEIERNLKEYLLEINVSSLKYVRSDVTHKLLNIDIKVFPSMNVVTRLPFDVKIMKTWEKHRLT